MWSTGLEVCLVPASVNTSEFMLWLPRSLWDWPPSLVWQPPTCCSMAEDAVHLAPGHPREEEAALDTSCLEAVPEAQWNVHLGKDQNRSHPLAACSLHQGEVSPGSVLVLAAQGSLLRLPRAEARMSFKHLERQLKKKGCEDHRFASCPLKVRVSGGFTPLWI